VSTDAQVEASIEWIRDFEGRFVRAWNSHQADRVLALMTEDIEYRDDAWPKTMHGHADVCEFLDALWTAFPDLNFKLVDGPYVIPGQPRSAVQWRGSGTHLGRLDPPGFAATHRWCQGECVNLQEYRDGRVCRFRSSADMLDVSRQLGLLPPTGSRTERALAGAQRAARRLQGSLRLTFPAT
jgi:steroid delta-isomerase-like uncharacterized protein